MNLKKENSRGRPVGSRKKKMNTSQVEDLLNKSLNEILDKHLSYNEYTKWINEEYDISFNQANVYWMRVWTLLNERYQLDRENLINKHLQKYWLLYDLAISKEDISNARQVLESISKLLGMNEPDKLDIKQELKIRFKFGSDDESEN